MPSKVKTKKGKQIRQTATSLKVSAPKRGGRNPSGTPVKGNTKGKPKKASHDVVLLGKKGHDAKRPKGKKVGRDVAMRYDKMRKKVFGLS